LSLIHILLTWRCSVPADRSALFLDGLAEETIVPHRSASGNGLVHLNVGFESGEQAVVIEEARAFLRRNHAKLQELLQLGGESEMDFAVLVGGERSFAPSLFFDPSFLSEIADSGVHLRVSAYPTSFEET
jgi:hypothetical protein